MLELALLDYTVCSHVHDVATQPTGTSMQCNVIHLLYTVFIRNHARTLDPHHGLNSFCYTHCFYGPHIIVASMNQTTCIMACDTALYEGLLRLHLYTHKFYNHVFSLNIPSALHMAT